MALFLIKKWFFDLWDNFLAIILLNLGFIVILAFPVFIPELLIEASPALSLFSLILGVFLFFIYAGAASLSARDIADYKAPEIKEFFGYIRESWVSSAILAAIFLLHFFILNVAFPVYSSMQNLMGLAAMVFLFWASVVWLLSSQFFFPIRARLDTKIGKVLRKCFVIFFDNTMFALFAAIAAIAIVVISAATAFLIPGIGGFLLWYQAGFKLRMYKYDYLEENPDANRRKIPWDALLIDDKERVGKRTLRGMIFPWKE
ncbi:MAG: hypothetical protein EA426_07845 [Spirochaetaceae bacterium]|nr:MAG: hypothetical protein EA426_07845 [Spirochaetaceae bacterium]